MNGEDRWIYVDLKGVFNILGGVLKVIFWKGLVILLWGNYLRFFFFLFDGYFEYFVVSCMSIKLNYKLWNVLLKMLFDVEIYVMFVVIFYGWVDMIFKE